MRITVTTVYDPIEGNMLPKYTVPSMLRAKAGTQSKFFIVNDKEGVKVFYSEGDARKSRNLQLLAYDNELGPAVNSGIMRVYKNGRCIGYGYLSDIADVDGSRVYDKYELSQFNKRYSKVFKSTWTDFHEANVGYYNNKLVVIDFGDCKVG